MDQPGKFMQYIEERYQAVSMLATQEAIATGSSSGQCVTRGGSNPGGTGSGGDKWRDQKRKRPRGMVNAAPAAVPAAMPAAAPHAQAQPQ